MVSRMIAVLKLFCVLSVSVAASESLPQRKAISQGKYRCDHCEDLIKAHASASDYRRSLKPSLEPSENILDSTNAERTKRAEDVHLQDFSDKTVRKNPNFILAGEKKKFRKIQIPKTAVEKPIVANYDPKTGSKGKPGIFNKRSFNSAFLKRRRRALTDLQNQTSSADKLVTDTVTLPTVKVTPASTEGILPTVKLNQTFTEGIPFNTTVTSSTTKGTPSTTTVTSSTTKGTPSTTTVTSSTTKGTPSTTTVTSSTTKGTPSTTTATSSTTKGTPSTTTVTSSTTKGTQSITTVTPPTTEGTPFTTTVTPFSTAATKITEIIPNCTETTTFTSIPTTAEVYTTPVQTTTESSVLPTESEDEYDFLADVIASLEEIFTEENVAEQIDTMEEELSDFFRCLMRYVDMQMTKPLRGECGDSMEEQLFTYLMNYIDPPTESSFYDLDDIYGALEDMSLRSGFDSKSDGIRRAQNDADNASGQKKSSPSAFRSSIDAFRKYQQRRMSEKSKMKTNK